MAIPWLLVLKSVPWADVVSNAPKIAEGARRLWAQAGRRKAQAEQGLQVPAPDVPPSLPMLAERLTQLESRGAAIDQELQAMSEMLSTLAEQNAALVRRIDANRRLMRAMGALLLVLSLVQLWRWLA